MCSLTEALEMCPTNEATVTAILKNLCQGFRPRLAGMTKLIAHFSKRREFVKALVLFNHLHDVELQADTAACNAALGACVKGHAVDTAWAIYLSMLRNGTAIDNVTYRTLMIALCQSDAWDLGVQVLAHLVHLCCMYACNTPARRFGSISLRAITARASLVVPVLTCCSSPTGCQSKQLLSSAFAWRLLGAVRRRRPVYHAMHDVCRSGST
jgi:PPR repeat family